MKKIRALRFPLLTVVLCFTISTTSNAQEGSFSCSIYQDTLLIGNYMVVEYVAENLSGDYVAPDFTDLNVISGPNMSTSMQFINGKTTQTIRYSYYIKPETTGTYFIPPAYYYNGEESFETEPLEFEVIENPEGIITQPKQKNEGFNSDFFDFSFPKFNFEYEAPRSDSKPNKKEKESDSKRKLKKI